jgi:hypothetical protein
MNEHENRAVVIFWLLLLLIAVLLVLGLIALALGWF